MDLTKCRQLREKIPVLSPDDLSAFYKQFPRIQDQTDNSRRCIEAIIHHISGRSVCDVGCGTGYLLSRISEQKDLQTLIGVDFTEHREWKTVQMVQFIEHDILNLPFQDGQFDTVISTHTLEHVLDIRAAVRELRRICGKRLIIVVPRERESIWSFNPHFHYFPYEHSFLKHLLPLSPRWHIQRIGRDFFYTEDRQP